MRHYKGLKRVMRAREGVQLKRQDRRRRLKPRGSPMPPFTTIRMLFRANREHGFYAWPEGEKRVEKMMRRHVHPRYLRAAISLTPADKSA